MRRSVTIIGVTAAFSGLGLVLTINEFLSVSHRVDGNFLVVEGWVWNSPAIMEASEEFKHGQYTLLVTVEGPIESNEGTPVRDNTAMLAAEKLKDLGMDKSRIIVLAVPNVSRHRTYASAVTLRDWLRDSGTQTKGVNGFTIGPHARKSLVLFSRALGAGIPVGVIAGTDDTYNPDRWWMSARGIYMILRKLLGNFYAVTWPLPENPPLKAA
jgi:hypothetical protein